MNTLSYAGIGSRKTPQEILVYMKTIGQVMATNGWTLRSGAAEGADTAFEMGCDMHKGQKEIFLPWRRFNNSTSLYWPPEPYAYDIAAKYHPNWGACSSAAMSLHARNVHQVLGPNFNDPVKLVICWTEKGTGRGGTGQAIRIARAYNIPVFDLGNEDLNAVIKQMKAHIDLCMEQANATHRPDRPE